MPKKILIVDDEPEVLNLFEKKLKNCGYNVLATTTGEMAIQMAKDISPDLIILDIRRPGIDGTQVFEYLKQDATTQHIPVLFVTAVDSPREIIRHFELGAENYLMKPVSPKVLLNEVEEILVGK